MKQKFDLQCRDKRIRGTYECSGAVSHDEVCAALTRCTSEMLSLGLPDSEICLGGERLARRMKDERGFENLQIHLRIDDISSLPRSESAKPTEWICSCGRANSGRFCVQCGAKKPAENRARFCSYCGFELRPGDNFCAGCGKKLN